MRGIKSDGAIYQLEKFDQKLTRGYVRWGRWVWRTLIVVPVLVVLSNIGQAVLGRTKRWSNYGNPQ
ncbi:hypothetical protein ACLK17_23740 [Escherichia coli]